MHRSLPHSTVLRFGLVAIIAALLARNAAAQADNTDPFVYLRGGAGDRSMDQLPGHDRGITYSSSNWNLITGDSNWPEVYYPLMTLWVAGLPPPLGEPVPGLDTGFGAFGSGSVTGLDGETFYVGFAILAGRGELAKGDTKRIKAYQQSRQQLLDEIHAKLDELAGANAADRAAALSALAEQQAVRLAALAGEEEEIRSAVEWAGAKFSRNLAFQNDHDEVARMLFAANFYAGLSVEERMLLVEIARIETSKALPGLPAQTATEGEVISFLPATSQVHLPRELPPALAAKISRFVAEKESLKAELRSTVVRDDYVLSSTRTRRLEALSTQQAPRFAELEKLADEIRVDLAHLGFRGQPNDLGLPDNLTQRVGSFYSRKVEVRRELLNTVRVLRRGFPGVGFDIKATGDGLAIVQTGENAKAAELVTKFNAAAAPQYVQFTRESESLTLAIQQYLKNSPERQSHTVDQLAADFLRAYVAQGEMNRYRDYNHAVLEPGLSFAQRRLLFTAALWPAKQPAAKPQP